MLKRKILIGCLSFSSLTGSELYAYELANGLIQNDYDVSVVSENIGGLLTTISSKKGIKVYNFQSLPKDEKFDIIHCQHVPITDKLIQLYPNIPKICSIHSELYEIENPLKHHSIKKYIAIRPQIKDHLIKNFNIKEEQIEIIYNPIDQNKFNNKDTTNNGYLLFVGSLDHVRRNPIFDLIQYTKQNNKELWVIGKNLSNYLPILLQYPHVKYFQPCVDVEKYVKNCSETAGILLGRTTIEGWMCGKSGWIYDIDSTGRILKKDFYDPPKDIEKFYSSNVINQIIIEYNKIIQS